MAFCLNIWNKAGSYLRLWEDQQPVKEIISDEIVLQQAHQELQQAQNWFANLDEPEMIDYAIYKIKAAEKHYDYLLKRIKSSRQGQTK